MEEFVLVLDDYLFGKAYLAAAKKAGYRTFLVSSAPSTDVPQLVDEHLSVNLNDIPFAVETILADPRFRSVAAVLPGHVYHVALQAQLCEASSLPSISPRAAERCLNKELFRRRLQDKEISQGWFFAITRDEIDVAIAKAHYPCVAKPVEGFASIGVMVVRNPSELRTALNSIFSDSSYERSGKSMGSKAVVEEYFDGPEFSVETLAFEGKTHIMGITGKYFDLAKSDFELGFELPADLSSKQAQIISDYVVEVHQALDILHGPTHCELRLTSSGPRVVEVNPRLGGAHLSELYETATGTSLYDVVLNNALGNEPPQPLPLPRKKAAATGWVLGHAGIIARVDGVEPLENARLVDMVIQRKVAGEKVPGEGDNRDRIVAFVASGKTLSDARNRLLKAENGISVQYQ